MSTLDFSRCKYPPFAHQREDVQWLLEHPYAFIASEMRTGKTKICIDTAQFLFEANTIDRVIVITPAPVRDVWYDFTLGEIKKHIWPDLPTKVTEYHTTSRAWEHAGGGKVPRALDWYVTNYEFLRSKARLERLRTVCGQRTLLILDESSFVKNHAAIQTIACLQLRHACGRVILLNGTPIFHSPLDLFSQGNILHPSILECKYITHFKARYAIQQPVLGYGGKPIKRVVGWGKGAKEIIIEETVGWTNLDDLQRRFAPVTRRRLQADCLDLPPKLDPVTLTATLTPETWKPYRAMRDEMVIWLQSSKVATSRTAAVKSMRLSQITSGFVGGVEDARTEPIDLAEILLSLGDNGDVLPDFSSTSDGLHLAAAGHPNPNAIQELGREKLDVLLWFLEERLKADPNLKIVAWCHFRVELFRMLDEVKKKFPQFDVGSIQGGQKKSERLHALSLLKPETAPSGPVFVGGIIGTGSFGLDMCAAHTCVTMSDVYSPGRSAQTLDRVYGPGQKFPIAYYNIVAVGPKGQRTIDHDILTTRLAGEDIATRTAEAWVKALEGE